MPNLEERVHALEREVAVRKKDEKLLTLAVRALATKEALEKLQDTVERSQEQNDKLFDVLNNHNVFTNERLSDLQHQIIVLDGKIVELDGKIVGQQTEMRQRFNELDGKIIALDGKIVNQQTEMQQRFTEQTALLQQILTRLPEKP